MSDKQVTGRPLLTAFLRAGRVKVEDGAYVGRTSDGEWVQLGVIGEEAAVEHFLETYGPEDW